MSKPHLKPKGPCAKRYPTLPRYVLPSGPSRAVRDRPAGRTRPHRAALPPHDTAVAVPGLRRAGGASRCGVAQVGACAVRMEAHDPGGGSSALPVLAVSTDLASPHHGGGAVEGETVAGRGDAGGQVDRGRPDVDRPGRGQPWRRVEHRLGCDPDRRHRAADRQRWPA